MPQLRSSLITAALVVFAASAQAEPTPLPIPASAVSSSAPIVRRGAALPAHPIAGGLGTATIYYDAATGSPELAMTLLVLQTGAAVPPHVHADSVELLYVIEGQAEMRVGHETFVIGPGDAARIPKGVEHEARVFGAATLRAVQVYTPPGPEQRFVPKLP